MSSSSKKIFFGFQKKTVFWSLYGILFTPICFEIALRLIGAEPYIQIDYHIQSVPENPFLGDDSLAIALNPGTYKITLNQQHTFTATHTQKKLRDVSFLNSSNDSLPEIAVLGCSFTYGYGVNDNEHFTSLLQKKHQNYQFKNYGVIGYGTTQSYLQLKKIEMQKEFPKVVVLNFATDHFNRDVLANAYRRALKIGFNRSLESAKTTMKDSKYPYVSDKNLKINYQKWSEMYNDWKGRSELSSVNWLQTTRDKIADNKLQKVELTFELIKKMQLICDTNNSVFLVSLLDENDDSEALKKLLLENNINYLDINFDFKNNKIINFPFDNHPNNLGHQLIGKNLKTK